MSYIEDSLSTGEQIRRIFPHHWVVKLEITLSFIVALFVACLVFIMVNMMSASALPWAAAALCFTPAIWIWISWRKTEQGVTSKRVIYKRGIISRQTEEMRLPAIESIEIEQGIVGRLLGYGTVTISGRGAGTIVLKRMTAPLKVKLAIENAEHDSER